MMTAFWVIRGMPPVLELEVGVEAVLPLPLPEFVGTAEVDSVVPVADEEPAEVSVAAGLLRVVLAPPSDEEPATPESFSAPAVMVTGKIKLL
jgi:hypothetical protein